jgi:hypothetical protein
MLCLEHPLELLLLLARASVAVERRAILNDLTFAKRVRINRHLLDEFFIVRGRDAIKHPF